MGALFLALLLAVPAPRAGASPSAPFEAALETAEAKAPKAAFQDARRLPEAFKAYLAAKGLKTAGDFVLETDGKTKLTNEKVALLFFDHRNARLEAALGPRPRLPSLDAVLAPVAAAGTSSTAQGKAYDGSKEDRSEGPATPPDVPPGGHPQGKPEDKPNQSRRGLRLLGIEIGAGSGTDDSRNEPFERKGPRDPLDWDIRARVKAEGLGARAHYRHPLPWRSLSLGFLKYWDWPGAVGLENARKDLYGAFGATPEQPQGGFEATVGSQFDAHWGAYLRYDQKDTLRGERFSDRNLFSVSGGYSPLGDNPGKPWNYTLIGSLNYQDLRRDYPDIAYKDDRSGFGYTAGVAFQHALDKLPWRWLGPAPGGNGWLWLDRAKLTAYAAQSEVSSLSFTAALELSVYVSKHVLLIPGLSTTWRPNPEEGDPDESEFGIGPTFSLDLKDLL